MELKEAIIERKSDAKNERKSFKKVRFQIYLQLTI